MSNDDQVCVGSASETVRAALNAGAASAPVAAQAAYTWDIESGSLSWDSGARDVFQVAPDRLPRSVKQLHDIIVDAHIRRRNEAIYDADERNADMGVPYHVFYRIMPGGYRSSRECWVEETGRWWPGIDGKPTRARGLLRIGPDVTKSATARSLNDYDELTGQLNRMRLMDALTSVLETVDPEDPTAALFLLSIDEMQIINDSFGYKVGDQLLAEVGQRLTKAIRGGDTVGRYSANKFGLIVSNCGPDTVELIARRFREAATARPVVTESGNLVPSVTVGITMLDEMNMNVDTALGRALRALDSARNQANGGIALYAHDTAKDLRRKRRAKIGEDVGKAIDDDRLKIVMQPVVDLKSRKPAFFECLLRIREPSEYLVSAADFIPVAERLGLAGQIDRRTLKLAIDVLRAHPDIRLSLNVSALTCTDSRWLHELADALEASPGVAQRLIVEITETMTATDLDEAAFFVDALKDLGCRVAIDDFGAGHTSFSTLRRLNADILKIDGNFVRDMLRNPRDQALVKAMVQLAKDLGMESVAEWVSDEETAQLLLELGTDQVQGFHFGKPMELEDLLESEFYTAVQQPAFAG
jgi:diguanylate cyclase (GGDEF)-like protein